MKKTKIICTLGPATDNEDIVRELILNGMSVARLNFSHQSHEIHLQRINMVKKLRKELGVPVAILADTKGPEIRTGTFSQPKVELVAGQSFTLKTAPCVGTNEFCSISYANLPKDIKVGSRILIDDGLIEMHVDSFTDSEIVCTVINGGTVSANKGVNVPGTHLSMPLLSSQDRSDIRFAIENDCDFIATSFTRNANDVEVIRSELERLGNHDIRIIAKIENAEGVANIDSILAASDGIMVARGDLGVEIPIEEIPVIQKLLIKKCFNAGKQVITATQMLESMMKNPRPTRAEITDIANAIYDGTSAIMLSGETAAGAYPVEAVRTMTKIAERTERAIDYEKRFRNRGVEANPNVTNAISHATCTTAHDLDAAAIITVTKSGTTGRMISKYRPSVPIICCSTDAKVQRQMNMSWGVASLMIDEKGNTDDLFGAAIDAAVKADLLKPGDLVVITAGVPVGMSGTTNMLKVHVIGDPISIDS